MVETASGAWQAPRLTSVLRALTTEGGNKFDAYAEFVKRAKLLESRNGGKAPSQGPGRSNFAHSLFGPWEKVPQPARHEYQLYLDAVARLLGGETSSSDLAESGQLVWDVLGSQPDQLEALPTKPSSRELTPIRETLSICLGHILEEAILPVVRSLQRLKRWQERLRQEAGGQEAVPVVDPQAGDTWPVDSLEAGLQVHLRTHSGSTNPEEAALALLGGLGRRNQPAAKTADWGGGDGATPFDLQQIYSSSAQRAAAPGPTQASLYTATGAVVIEDDDDNDAKKGVKADVLWLQRWCERVMGPGEPAAELAMMVSQTLLMESAGETVATRLLEMLGDSAFEHVSELMEVRKPLTDALSAAISKARSDEVVPESSMPMYGTGVTIKSESQKQLQKMERKEKRKGKGKSAAAEADLEWLLAHGWPALLEAVMNTSSSSTFVFDGGIEFKVAEGSSAMVRGVLPVGTTRKNFKGYEEVKVPAPPPLPPPPENEVVKISSLEDWAQLAFAGYKALNRIQSRIFRTAYHSNENILVCAPTGAGKTNIAMIAVLREIGANMHYGVIQKNAFKIVYVAPMKALAAEVTANFGKRLQPLGMVVRELTGDMQLSKKELEETQMIVTTPEKWDVITRKGGDVSIASLVKLLIIDEVHLLNDDRGPVIETLVARTLRQVEASQNMIRIVGLSATLPNYKDVATFLRVNADTGLFFFDSTFRPVPLEMEFVGVSERNFMMRINRMNEICYNKAIDAIKREKQCMVFVHSRKDTGKTGRTLVELAMKANDLHLLEPNEHPKYPFAQKEVRKSRNKELVELFDSGFGIHHAGMLRSDRNLVERLFADGLIKVLICTATLAWGVNLPAHTVIIRGTQVYDAQKGSFTDLGMLDVQQIFGRAGRPQFDNSGQAVIITTHDKLAHYLGMLTHSIPIESQFSKMLVDNLNAEIVLGTVTNVREAMQWLTYTYMYVRMMKNPLPYGLTYQDLATDPALDSHKRDLILLAAKKLRDSKMAVLDDRSGNLFVTELGRVASHFYIKHESIVTFNSLMKHHMTEDELLSMIAQSSEFESMMVRDEELMELDKLLLEYCPYNVKGGPENKHGKACILMQAYVSRAKVESFSLIADMMYCYNNAPRIMRALFELCLRRKWSSLADTTLTLAKSFEKRLWPHQHPLRQFESVLSYELLNKLEERGLWIEQLQDMDAKEIGSVVRHPSAGALIKSCVDSFPSLDLDVSIQPITRTVLRVQLTIKPTFVWKDRAHGGALRWLLWVEDSANEHMYHSEMWTLTKKMMNESAGHVVAFTIPIFEPLPSQYYVRVISDSWMHAEAFLPITFQNLILPELMPPHTELLDLDPLPVSALGNPSYEAMYTRFSHFNPIQTQAFHTLYHTDENVLLGAPTGSGKTISSELTMLRVFTHYPNHKIIYIAPLKALVRERIEDWTKGLCARLGKKMVELTGDYTPDLKTLMAADIIIATPEKWDGISRQWQTRSYVTKMALMIIDEIHLLGADRGPVLEVIVSRMRYIAAQTNRSVRFVGLSTALANAQDLADWLGITSKGLFNFKPSVRPVPLECHIQGYPGKFYCPRMATMNKPSYAAIQVYSPTKPVLIFVSSRRQTRLTALDLITYAAADEKPRQWVNVPEDVMDELILTVKDPNLRHTLQFGIGLHHAGLNDRDRSLVEKLFVEQKIQILVATSTLAWGVNTPTHLAIIKGTEFYDAPSKRYVDYPITDVLQMMGRAGRPQYDRHGVAVVMVHEPKKQFYKRFLYEPFPVESSLKNQLPDHFNAEIVAGTISTKQDAVDYLTWTFFFRRLVQNPSYYDLASTNHEDLNDYLTELVEMTLETLQDAGCISLDSEDGRSIEPLAMGRIAAYYYLKHATMQILTERLEPNMDMDNVLQVLCSVAEYDEMPVRHNEDLINTDLNKQVRWPLDSRTADDPHTKTNLLLQSHMMRLPPPMSDYATDTKSALDNSLRVLQAMVDCAADAGWLDTALTIMNLVQCLMQARWLEEPSLSMLPHMTEEVIGALARCGIETLPELMDAVGPNSEQRETLGMSLAGWMGGNASQECLKVVERLPVVGMKWHEPMMRPDEEGEVNETSDMSMEVQLTRLNGRGGKSSGAMRVYAPKYPKVKEEGWWLLLGDINSRELLAIRRISFAERTTCRLRFPRFNSAGEELNGVSIFLMSDSYIGLDQQYYIPLKPGAEAVEAAQSSNKARRPRSQRTREAVGQEVDVSWGALKKEPQAATIPEEHDAEDNFADAEDWFWGAKGGDGPSGHPTSNGQRKYEEGEDEPACG